MFYKVLSHLIIEIKTLRKSVEKEVLKYSKIVVKFYSEIFHRAFSRCKMQYRISGYGNQRLSYRIPIVRVIFLALSRQFNELTYREQIPQVVEQMQVM